MYAHNTCRELKQLLMQIVLKRYKKESEFKTWTSKSMQDNGANYSGVEY